jgi:hypothetical protein
MKKYTIEATIRIIESENKYSSGTEVFSAETRTVSTVMPAHLSEMCQITLDQLSSMLTRSTIGESSVPKIPVGYEPPLGVACDLPSDPVPEVVDNHRLVD